MTCVLECLMLQMGRVVSRLVRCEDTCSDITFNEHLNWTPPFINQSISSHFNKSHLAER